jgi:hypothetical protein
MHLVEGLNSLDLAHCIDLEKEFISAPSYLSNDEQSKVANYLENVKKRCSELTEDLRLSKVKVWQKQFISLEAIDNPTKYEIERLLKALKNPPVELTKSEQVSVQSFETRLITRIDQISVDDILYRIEKLPMGMQHQLLQILSERLSG